MSEFYQKAAACPYVRDMVTKCPWMHSQVTSCPFLTPLFNNADAPVIEQQMPPITKEVSSMGLMIPSFPPVKDDIQ